MNNIEQLVASFGPVLAGTIPYAQNVTLFSGMMSTASEIRPTLPVLASAVDAVGVGPNGQMPHKDLKHA